MARVSVFFNYDSKSLSSDAFNSTVGRAKGLMVYSKKIVFDEKPPKPEDFESDEEYEEAYEKFIENVPRDRPRARGKAWIQEHHPQGIVWEYDPDKPFKLHGITAEYIELTYHSVPYRIPPEADVKTTIRKAA